MASKKVEDAVETYLRANWSESVVLTENLEQEIPQDGAPFLTLEFPVSDSDWPGLNGVQWRAEGGLLIVLAGARGGGVRCVRPRGGGFTDLLRPGAVWGRAWCRGPAEAFTGAPAGGGRGF